MKLGRYNNFTSHDCLELEELPNYRGNAGYRDIIPVMIYRDKCKFWYLAGYNPHRPEGPTIVYTDASAVEFNEGVFRSWYWLGEELTEKVNAWCHEYDIDEEDMSEEELLIMWNEIA